jgi:hypothetical protein
MSHPAFATMSRPQLDAEIRKVIQKHPVIYSVQKAADHMGWNELHKLKVMFLYQSSLLEEAMNSLDSNKSFFRRRENEPSK